MVKKDKEIYVSTDPGNNIFMWSKKYNEAIYWTGDYRSNFNKHLGGGFKSSPFRLPTVEEKEWFLFMINKNKYIPYDKFLKESFSKIYELW